MKTSVALCTYNGEKYISVQIDSILKQTILPDEIIICDDGSSDATIEIIQKYQKQYPKIIKLSKNSTNLQVVKNFEKAINLCSGDLIFLSDQDDVWKSDKIEKSIKFLDQNPGINAFFHDLELWDGDTYLGRTLWDILSFPQKLRSQKFKNKRFLEYILLYNNIVTGAALVFKKEILQEILPLHNDIPILLHDYEIALKLALKDQIIPNNESLGYYRIHQNQQVGINSLQSDPIKTKATNQFLSSNSKKNWKLEIEYLYLGLQRATQISEIIPQLKKYTPFIEKKIYIAKHKCLQKLSFISKKKLLLSWYINKKYNISLLDVLLK